MIWHSYYHKWELFHKMFIVIIYVQIAIIYIILF